MRDTAIYLVQGGQTGVDRGAFYAAKGLGWGFAGYMPNNGRDEMGMIPEEVAAHLERCHRTGLAARTEENIRIADALLVVVPDEDDPRETPGTALTLERARDRKVRREVVDPGADAQRIEVLARWIGGMTIGHPREHFHLMVAGPRESRWPAGRGEAAGLLRQIGRLIAERSDRR